MSASLSYVLESYSFDQGLDEGLAESHSATLSLEYSNDSTQHTLNYERTLK